MIHNNISHSQHWAVSHNSFGNVLVQLGDSSEQVRIALSPAQAQDLVSQLQAMIKIAQRDSELEFRIICPRKNITSNMIVEENDIAIDLFLSNMDPVMWSTNENNALHFLSFEETKMIIDELKALSFVDLYFDRIQP